MHSFVRILAASGVAAAIAAPVVGYAHFRLIEPASWIVENERGDPQKAGPCGGSNTDWGKPTFAVNKVVGGSKLHLKVQETVYHPGHYRVALAVNSPLELPADPVTQTTETEKGPRSVTATIQNPPAMPVLADGLFVHNTRPEAGTQLPPMEADVDIPNINCKTCTLQIVQWMAEHGFNNPGGYTYHHCATLQITADPKKPIDTAWPAERTATN
jgi:hypothetical protein